MPLSLPARFSNYLCCHLNNPKSFLSFWFRQQPTAATVSSAITNPHHHHRRCYATAPEPNRKAKSNSSLTKLLPSLPQQHSPSPAPVSATHSLSNHFSNVVRWIPDGSLEYYADFASKLAEDGRIEDVALIVTYSLIEDVASRKRRPLKGFPGYLLSHCFSTAI
ncbi:predicted protein [Arabidopsis lyrata subsp. lyrata]|uniref:Predicted protein n=1 Tax=Arabidopsis lyrata subsp. lyrata TaxID=81972 RepID=D7KK43_ARALL|nr:predicted protein [Arabidopsis lyrata subsp. lyrata]